MAMLENQRVCIFMLGWKTGLILEAKKVVTWDAADLMGGFFGFEVKLKAQSYPLVNVYITMGNHHAIDGKTHDFYGYFQ